MRGVVLFVCLFSFSSCVKESILHTAFADGYPTLTLREKYLDYILSSPARSGTGISYLLCVGKLTII